MRVSIDLPILDKSVWIGSSEQFVKINKNEDDSMSSKALLTKIKYIIDNEDHKKPYSDEKIVLILGEQGINIARRTISKYRGILKILPSSQRKI